MLNEKQKNKKEKIMQATKRTSVSLPEQKNTATKQGII
jgi:hypothetical protein